MSDYTQSAKEILIVTSFSKWGLSREGLTIFTYLLEFWNNAIRNSDWCTGATVLFKSLKEIFLITRNYNAKIATNLQCSNARIMKECLFRKKWHIKEISWFWAKVKKKIYCRYENIETTFGLMEIRKMYFFQIRLWVYPRL